MSIQYTFQTCFCSRQTPKDTTHSIIITTQTESEVWMKDWKWSVCFYYSCLVQVQGLAIFENYQTICLPSNVTKSEIHQTINHAWITVFFLKSIKLSEIGLHQQHICINRRSKFFYSFRCNAGNFWGLYIGYITN